MAPFTVLPQSSACHGDMGFAKNGCDLKSNQERHRVGHRGGEQGDTAGEDQDRQQLSYQVGGLIIPLRMFQRFVHRSLFVNCPAGRRLVLGDE